MVTKGPTGLADQFLGYIHGECIGPGGTTWLIPPGLSRKAHVDLMAKQILASEASVWSTMYKTPVPQSFFSKSISVLSAGSIAMCHLFMEMGANSVGYVLRSSSEPFHVLFTKLLVCLCWSRYEEDSTIVHVPMRIAFMRGAARQYNGSWINYASGNFGDACNYFTQIPCVR